MPTIDCDTDPAALVPPELLEATTPPVFDACRSRPLWVEMTCRGGAMGEGRVEKLVRDAALFFHRDGTNDIHRFGALKDLFPVRPATTPGETAPGPGRVSVIASEIG